MVDIEPIIEYDYSNFGIRNMLDIFIFLYIAFISPIFTILNYDIKNNKEAIQDVVSSCIRAAKCSMYKVSKRGLVMDKNIMYMTNHVSVGDFFIDPHVLHYTSKFISLNKMRIMLPVLGIICYLTSYTIFINQGNSKEKVLENFKKIEELRKKDDTRNVSLYPEGLRRPHRHTVSATLKKGFIYHSFENNLPIQIVHTTNKDYVIDDTQLILHKNTKIFTYYGPKIDPQKLKAKFEKKHKRPYTKDDYYNHVYKCWSKIWSKMDKYRIDTLRSQGLSHEECLEKMESYSTKFPIIEDKIKKGDTPLPVSFLLLRSTLWSIVYFIIFKIVEKSFSVISYIYKCGGGTASASANASASDTCSLGCSFFKFPFLKNLLFSHASVTCHAAPSSSSSSSSSSR
jgi:1-acyl-sn-glycerol-3-phosphate acyltransferase